MISAKQSEMFGNGHTLNGVAPAFAEVTAARGCPLATHARHVTQRELPSLLEARRVSGMRQMYIALRDVSLNIDLVGGYENKQNRCKS